MNSVAADHRTPDGKSPTSVWLLRNPLDFIAEDHLRLRTICADVDRLAHAGKAQPDEVAGLVQYLTQELPLLLADEDDDLLPWLLKRAEPEDELPKLAARLDAEHKVITEHLQRVVLGLEALDTSGAIPESLAAEMLVLANTTRRHLILENAVLIPLARARLSQDDLFSLRVAIQKRRGLEDLFETKSETEPNPS